MKTKYGLIQKLVSLVSVIIFTFAFVPTTGAASLSSISDTLTTIKAGSTANHVVKFTTPTGVDQSTDTITILFTSFTGSVVAADVTLTHGATTGLETSETVQAAAGSNIWGASWSVPTLTLTAPTNAAAGEITAADKVIVSINNNKLTNPAIGSYIINIAGTFGDTGRAAVVTITDDQIPVTSVVNPSISMTVANTTLDLGILSSSNPVASGANAITIGTNASKGYLISVISLRSGLYNGTIPKTIASATATPLANNTEGYGMQCGKTSGDGACVAAHISSPNNITGVSGTPATFASHSSKPTGTDQFTIGVKAGINASTDAGTYTDTLTVVGTATF